MVCCNKRWWEDDHHLSKTQNGMFLAGWLTTRMKNTKYWALVQTLEHSQLKDETLTQLH